MPCAACGHEASADARFCPACGAPLEARPRDDATRKTVSVVFIDVAGSTALGERLDPEALRAVLEVRAALATLNDGLERAHGVRLAARTGINTGEVVVGGEGAASDQRLA